MTEMKKINEMELENVAGGDRRIVNTGATLLSRLASAFMPMAEHGMRSVLRLRASWLAECWDCRTTSTIANPNK